jgi:GH24 family phage-related lysozyme (muramidase)
VRTIIPAALTLILTSEGIDQPSNVPPLGSGITIGYGDDIGNDPQGFEGRWEGILGDDTIRRLASAKGRTGASARSMASAFTDIHITPDQALQSFTERTLPRYVSLTQGAFPGSDNLPDAAFGALVSLIYNRGEEMADSPDNGNHARRAEMRDIRDAVAKLANPAIDPADVDKLVASVVAAIAIALLAMKRLWNYQTAAGLLTRRDNEAKLALSSLLTHT